MMQTYSLIKSESGSTFYRGEPLTVAEAQMAINEAIARRHLPPNAYLRVEADRLVIDQQPLVTDPVAS